MGFSPHSAGIVSARVLTLLLPCAQLRNHLPTLVVVKRLVVGNSSN